MLRNIFSHELTHYRRGDIVYKWFAALVFSLHWINPLAFIFRREIDRACELSCDEQLLKDMSADEKRSYGETLLELAAKRPLPGSVVATSFATQKRDLKERLEQIMTYKNKSRAAIALALAAALLLAAAFALRGACLNYVTDDYRNFLSVWVDFFRAHGGLAALRAPVGNYNVPYLTVLALISSSPLPDLHLIKLFSILFDVLLAWSVMQLVGLFRRSAAWKLAAFFLVLFWPTVVLNGALWGQCDSVYAALAVLSVYLVLSGHPLLGVVSIGASFAFKLQAVFVMPVFLIFWLTRRVRLRHLLVFPAVCVVMVLPAVIAGRGLWDALTIPFQQTGSIGTGLNYNSPSVFALFGDVANPDAAVRLGIGAAARATGRSRP